MLSTVFVLSALVVAGITLLGFGGSDSDAAAADQSYSIVDTGQSDCCNNDGETTPCPAEGEAFYEQDAQVDGTAFAFQANGDGTVADLSTGPGAVHLGFILRR